MCNSIIFVYLVPILQFDFQLFCEAVFFFYEENSYYAEDVGFFA